jgi:hypothetical protein
VFLFRATRACEEVVENMEIPLASWDISHPAPFQSVVEYLPSNQGWVDCRRGVVLELVEQAGLGRCGRGGCLGGGQGVENVGSER